MKNKNEYKYYLNTALWHVVTMMINGSVLQSCMLEIGIVAGRVSFFVSAMQIIQVAIMLGISKYTEKIKKIFPVYALTSIIQLLISGIMLFMCYANNISADIKFYVIFAVGMVANIALGAYNVISYMIPYRIMDMDRYGSVMGISGTICGIIGIVFSSVLAFFLERYAYIDVIKVFYITAIVFTVTVALIILSFRDNGYKGDGSSKEKIKLFSYKPFTSLIIPNLLRGFNSGAILLLLTIGYHIKIINSVSAGYFVVITNASMILSCVCYSFIARFNRDKWIIVISSIVMAVFMPFMCFGGNTTVFLSVYAIVYFVFNLINYSVPVLVTKIVGYEIIGQYSSWRMLLHTLGGALAGVVCIPMIDIFGTIPALIIIGAMQLISGATYFICASKNEK